MPERTTSGAARPTVRGRETLAAIDVAARKVIADKGALRTTVADIAKEAGRAPASFYGYYTSKEDLLKHWAQEFQSDVQGRALPAFASGLTHRQRVEQSARAHWETYRDRLAEMVGVSQMAMVSDEFAQYWHEMCQPAVDAIAETIRRAQREGYCPDLRPQVTASAIVAMLNQFCYDHLATPGVSRDVTDDEAIAALADIWYRAIFWKPQPD